MNGLIVPCILALFYLDEFLCEFRVTICTEQVADAAWFYDHSACLRAGELVARMVRELAAAAVLDRELPTPVVILCLPRSVIHVVLVSLDGGADAPFPGTYRTRVGALL